MNKFLLCLVLLTVATIACAQSPHSEVYKIHELCGKERTDPVAVTKLKQLGIDLNVDESRFYQTNTRNDYRFVRFTLNPQPTYNNIQGIFISWNKSSELGYEEIQNIFGLELPKRGSKKIDTDQGYSFQTRYLVFGYRPDIEREPINQITVTCKKNNYDAYWEVKLTCFGFIHPEND